MTYVIEACPWSSKERRQAFLRAIASPDRLALTKLWEANLDWREEIGHVLLTCLRVLRESGMRRCKRGKDDTDDFRVLYQPSREDPVYKITLKISEHPWMRFLKDTDCSAAMAVMVEDSLRPPKGYHHGRRHRMQLNRPSLLETALCVDRQCAALSPEQVMNSPDIPHISWPTSDRNWKYVWNVRNVRPDALIWVTHERLKILDCLGSWFLLAEWNNPIRDKVSSPCLPSTLPASVRPANADAGG